jgi:hypothetical protein
MPIPFPVFIHPQWLTSNRKDPEDSSSRVYIQDCPANQRLVAATLSENEIALVVYEKEDGELCLTGLRFRINRSTRPATLQGVDLLLGSPLILQGYPNSISVVRHSDGSTHGIVCTAIHNLNRTPGSSLGTDDVHQSTVFKIEEQAFEEMDSSKTFLPFDQTSKLSSIGI